MRLADAASVSRQSTTGAACTRLVVNTPAAVHGASLQTSPRSSFPLGFKPHAVAAVWNPGASVNAACSASVGGTYVAVMERLLSGLAGEGAADASGATSSRG